MLRRFAVTSLVAVVALATAAFAVAGNGGAQSKSSSSISLVMLSTSATPTSATSGPSFGDQVTFGVSTNVTTNPQVTLGCFQSGVAVYWLTRSFAPDSVYEAFTLSSNAWTGGAADCTATLSYWNGKSFKDLASTSFHVNA
jgi:hypothetical protein